MVEKMRIAVIGTGYWGKNHVRALKELMDEGKVEELYICDSNNERAREMASNYNLPYYTDYKQLPSLDAVIIATPSDSHYEIAKNFLEIGKDVLVEKPMTLNSKKAEELIKIAEKNGNVLMVGHIFRYHPAVVELKNKIERGDFGKIYYIMSNRLSLRQPRNDMGVLFALGIHEVDLFCYLLDEDYPEAIFAVISNYLGSVEETAQITTYFKNGIKGYAFESWITPVYGKRRELVIVGSRLSAFVDYLKPNEISFFDSMINSKGVTIEGSYIIPLKYKEPLKEELKDFINCIEQRRQPVANMYTGKRAVEMIEAAMKAAKEGKRIKI